MVKTGFPHATYCILMIFISLVGNSWRSSRGIDALLQNFISTATYTIYTQRHSNTHLKYNTYRRIWALSKISLTGYICFLSLKQTCHWYLFSSMNYTHTKHKHKHTLSHTISDTDIKSHTYIGIHIYTLTESHKDTHTNKYKHPHIHPHTLFIRTRFFPLKLDILKIFAPTKLKCS